MTHHERMHNCLYRKDIQTNPVSFWRHFPHADQSADNLANATIAWQRKFDFDFVKVTPASSFCLKDWGVEDEYLGNPFGIRNYKRPIIHQPDDWLKLPVLEAENQYLNQQIEALRKIKKVLGNSVPIVQSIFNPLVQMENMAGNKTLNDHLQRFPEAVLAGLETISKSTANFVQKAVATGIDGIFFIIKHAPPTVFSNLKYSRFGVPFDNICLQPASKLWMNILHLHSDNPDFDDFENFPTAMLSMHGLHHSGNLLKAISSSEKILCGGLQRVAEMGDGTEDEIARKCSKLFNETAGKQFVLSAECGLRLDTADRNIFNAVNLARENEKKFQ
jgi:uroporphyrinogen decarboxylase